MTNFENGWNTLETQWNTVSNIRDQVSQSINDSKLTVIEANHLRYSLDSAIDDIQSETHHELRDSMRDVLVSWININRFSSAERRIGDYLWIDLPWYVALLEQDWYPIPDNYSIRDSGTYLVFHDENGKDIATINWETHETGWWWVFIKNDDRTDNLDWGDLADSYDINRRWIEEDKMSEIQEIKENLFDANIIFEDPFDYNSIQLASESFWLSETEFRNMIIEFQRQVVLDWHSPHQENLWKNIGIFERWGNELWFNQNTPDWQYVGIYDRSWNPKKSWIWS